MIADIGTKTLSAGRIKELKVLMGMLPENEVTSEETQEEGGQLYGGGEVKEKVLRMILLAAMMQVGATQPGSEEEDEIPVDPVSQTTEDANVFRLMVLMYTIAIVLATVVIQRFLRQFARWHQTSVASSMDPEERRRYQEEERDRTYAMLQSRIRRADRERREAEDQLMELDSQRSDRTSQRRRGGRLRRMVSGSEDRSRTPSMRSVARSSRYERSMSEEEIRTERYGSRTRDDDEESQLGSAMEDQQESEEGTGGREDREEERAAARGVATREDVRDRHTRDERRNDEEQESMEDETQNVRRRPLLPEGEIAQLERGVRRLEQRLEGPEEEEPTPGLFSPSPSPITEEAQEGPSGEETPEDIAGPAHWIEEIQGLVEGVLDEEAEEEAPLDESPEPDPEGDDPDGGGGAPGPNPPGLYVPEYTVRRTANGTRYHTDDRCCTLANTRRMERSHWCPTCARITDAQRYGSVYLTPTGAVAHLDLHCPVLNGPPWIHYPHCQRCSRYPTRRPNAPQGG